MAKVRKSGEWRTDFGKSNGSAIVYLARFMGDCRVLCDRLEPEAAYELARQLMSAADNAKNIEA